MSDNILFCLNMNIFYYFLADSIDVYFMAHHKIIDHTVYLGAQQIWQHES